MDEASDDGAIGPLAVVLLLVGAGLVIAGLTALVPTWLLACGIGVFVLGAILPLRAVRRARRGTR